MALVLASNSPRRHELFGLVASDFVVDAAGIAETATAASPSHLALELATQKAGAVFARRPADCVIGCDTVVEVHGEAVGKPRNAEDAMQILQKLSGRRHFVHTGVCILCPGKAPVCFTETSAVDFYPIPAAAIAAYVQTTEPYDKAGGYGIQGWAARYIPRVEGCFYNVMGLPVAHLSQVLVALQQL